MTTEEKRKIETLTIKVDGKLIPAKPGQTVIQAAQDAGIYIPYLCYCYNTDTYRTSVYGVLVVRQRDQRRCCAYIHTYSCDLHR